MADYRKEQKRSQAEEQSKDGRDKRPGDEMMRAVWEAEAKRPTTE